jgi:hypothetical protein
MEGASFDCRLSEEIRKYKVNLSKCKSVFVDVKTIMAWSIKLNAIECISTYHSHPHPWQLNTHDTEKVLPEHQMQV